MDYAPRRKEENSHKRVSKSRRLKRGETFSKEEEDQTSLGAKERTVSRNSNSGRPLLLKLESPKVEAKSPQKSNGRQSEASQQLMDSEFSEQDMRDL